MLQHHLANLASKPALNVWLGPDSHAVCYPLKRGSLFNIVIACPDDMPTLVNSTKANVQEMRSFFEQWDSKLRALLSIVQETAKWRLMNSTEMTQWSHPSGIFVLLGDACHATLPTLAQGAALAVEDGAVLGRLFEKVQTHDHLRDVLVIYERIRKSRTTRVVKESTQFRDIFQMRDCPRQQERDRQLLEEEPFEGYPNRLADPELQPWLYGYDAHAEADRAWEIYLQGRFPGTDGGSSRRARSHSNGGCGSAQPE